MQLPKQILEYGISLELIKEIHSKTKLGKYPFDKIEFVRSNSDSILIRLRLVITNTNYQDWMHQSYREKTRNVVIEISLQKIREKKLNQIFH
jgi:hypothetical protein